MSVPTVPGTYTLLADGTWVCYGRPVIGTPAASAVGRVTRIRGASAGAAAGGGGTPVVRPSGPGYSRYEDIQTGSLTLQQVLNLVPGGNVLTLPTGTFSFNDFANGYVDGLRIGSGGATGCKGIIGSGNGQDGFPATILQMTPNSSTKASIGNATTGTNPCYLLNISGTAGAVLAAPILKNFQLKGTPQGHWYNGISVTYANDANLDGLFINGAAPGYSNFPPGETFGIGNNHTSRMTIRNTEVDGRDPVSRARLCASPIGWNNSDNAFIYDTYAHHSKTGMVTFYQTVNVTTVNLRSEFNGSGGGILSSDALNHEMCSGLIKHTTPSVIIDRANGNGGLHFAVNTQAPIGNDTTVQVIEPSFDAGPTAGCFSVAIYNSYGTGQLQTTLPSVVKAGRTLIAMDSSNTSGANPAVNFVRYH